MGIRLMESPGKFPFSGARMGSICLDGLTHADSCKGIACASAELSGRLDLVNTHADLHRSRSGSQAIGFFLRTFRL
jgi:hypothetical protein